MNDNNDLEQIEQLIERLEKDFSDLKLAVRRIKSERTTAPRATSGRTTQELEVGCKAKITNNIGPFQEREGKVIRLNKETDRVTVQGRRRKGKVVRATRNVIRIERYTEE